MHGMLQRERRRGEEKRGDKGERKIKKGFKVDDKERERE